MCDINLDPCDVWRESHRKARKEHVCSCCRRAIRPGETYLVHFSVFEGDARTQKCCAECDRDRDVFAEAHGGTLSEPSYFGVLLGECIGEGDDNDERWRPMLSRIRASMADARERAREG